MIILLYVMYVVHLEMYNVCSSGVMSRCDVTCIPVCTCASVCVCVCVGGGGNVAEGSAKLDRYWVGGKSQCFPPSP